MEGADGYVLAVWNADGYAYAVSLTNKITKEEMLQIVEEIVKNEKKRVTVANMIDEIDRKIVTIKHALNLTNATAKVQVGEQEMSIDGILIRMAQLNKRKAVLDDMRKRLPKTRVYGSSFGSSGSSPFRWMWNWSKRPRRMFYGMERERSTWNPSIRLD